MNRILLIGNGFDLAHKLETKYEHFINDFWEQKTEKVYNEYIEQGKPSSSGNRNIQFSHKDDPDIQISTAHYSRTRGINFNSNNFGYNKFKDLISFICQTSDTKSVITNQFLIQISENFTLKNWVDIEVEYYTALKQCLENKRLYGIVKLNDEFTSIKIYLEEYLKKQVIADIVPLESILNLMDNIIPTANLQHKERLPHLVSNVLFLNFNYTPTADCYASYLKKGLGDHSDLIDSISIHGELDNSENPIIFGYGDELDETYKQLEDKNDQDLLENVKSIKYLNTRNYQKMLAFINSSEYQIIIMGHSCGISDRTLLNTLFEHKNCKSIKIYYHKRENTTDDYSDIIKNISRNFTDKELMREIVTPKEDCEPLSSISKKISEIK